MPIELNDLATILRASCVDLFQDRSGYPKVRAQDNLNGRTHYVDENTLKFFSSKIVSAEVTCSGTLFYIVESVALDSQNTRRGFRGVVFDVWGQTVYRPDLENCHSTSNKARKAMYEWLNKFDLAAHYMRELENRARRLDNESRRLREASGLIYSHIQNVGE